jgi:diguanylate cyclase (GGDEF)-like protein
VEDASTGLPSNQIRRFGETIDVRGAHTLWALTWDKGLLVRRDGRWLADPDNAGLPHTTVLSMAQTQTLGGVRRQWLGLGTAGLWYRDEGTHGWRPWHAPGLDGAQVEYLLRTEHEGHEELWLSVFGSGLWRLSSEGMRRWSREEGTLPTDEIYGLAVTSLEDGDRVIWLSSRSGLLRVHRDEVQAFDRRYGLASNVVRGLNVWRSPSGNDVIWMATEAGVSRTVLGVSPWSTVTLMGESSTGVFGLMLEPDGHGGERLWVGAKGDGLALYEQGRWHNFSATDGTLPEPSVTTIVAARGKASGHQRWVGLRGGDLLLMQDDNSFEPQDGPWLKVSSQAIPDVLERTFDGKEELWVAARQGGVYRRRDGQWTAFAPPGVVGEWSATKLQEQIDAGGRSWLWATTNQGLARFDGQTWALFGHAAGLRDSLLLGLSLIPDAQGHPVLWMGSVSGGVQRMDVSDPRNPRLLPDTLPPPPDPTVYSALRDSQGRIYLCTNNGVQQLTPLASGYRSRVFTRRDGMVHDECNTNAQMIDAHDRYWAGTLGGLTVYDPQREIRDTHAKPLRITGTHVDGQAVDPGVAGLEVSAGTKTIEIQFALLSWYQESESRFRTRLIGLEDTPGNWTTQDSRTYSSLSPGSYRLRIEAMDELGNVSVPVELPILVAAHWWQQPWVTAAGGLVILLLAYGATQWRTRALQSHRRALEYRVAERTAALDAANARLLELSYCDELTGLANRRRLLERLEQFPEETTPSAQHALLLIDVDHFKNYNDRFGHLMGDEALRQVAAAMQRCVPADAVLARYGGEEFACLLPNVSVGRAAALAERVRSTVAGLPSIIGGTAGVAPITISIGVACGCIANTADADRLLRDADIALYQAKREGRNRVQVWQANGVPSAAPNTDDAKA